MRNLQRPRLTGKPLMGFKGSLPTFRHDHEKENKSQHAEIPARKKSKGNHQKSEKTEVSSTVYGRMSLESPTEKDTLAACTNNDMGLQNDMGIALSLVASLKACTIQKDLHRGSILHSDIVKSGLLKSNVFMGSTLVSMYAKCGALDKAREVFDELPVRNVVSWTAIIGGYAQHGRAEEALDLFEKMQLAGFAPDAVTFVCALKACGSIGASSKGEEIHGQIVKECLLGKHMVLSNALIDMYTKCGTLEKAQEVFDSLPVRTVVSWNTLIAGYSLRGYNEQALNCFEQMQLKGFLPNAITYTCILKVCGSVGALDMGRDIHAQIDKEDLLANDVVLSSALVDMYARCRAVEKAQDVFDESSAQDVISWNALIGGYSQLGYGEKALKYFQQMQSVGFSPDVVTFACILKACGSLGASKKGREIHAQIVRGHPMGKHVMVLSALVDMYAKCGALDKAQELFDELTFRDVVLWNTLIAGYAQHRLDEEALSCFERMQRAGFSPDSVTFACILKSCGSIGALRKGEEVHGQLVKEERLLDEVVVANALVHMYAKCGALEKAQEVLDSARTPRDTIAWTALIAGYAQHERGEDALNCFESMQRHGCAPDAFTFACVLKACGNAGAANKGRAFHSKSVKLGMLEEEEDIVITTALVFMYANCGMVREAQQLYERLPFWDAALWSVLMVGYVQSGKHASVFGSLNKMIQEGLEPDSIMFTILLSTCSHSGLVVEGRVYFETMRKGHGIIPTLDHHTCLVDLFGRTNCLDTAAIVIEEMPHLANLTMWLTLLGACQKLGNVKLGKWAFEHAVELDRRDPGAYVCMSNVYATADRQEYAVLE